LEAGSLKKADGKNEGDCCRYVSIQGHAEILRVQQTPDSISQAQVLGGPRYEGYEVWFRFRPESDDPLDRIQKIIIREHLLTLNNGWYVGSRFLEKYGIQTGKSFPCILKVIEKGACTPVVFEFETIDLKDYL
jgi:hypothetical protein